MSDCPVSRITIRGSHNCHLVYTLAWYQFARDTVAHTSLVLSRKWFDVSPCKPWSTREVHAEFRDTYTTKIASYRSCNKPSKLHISPPPFLFFIGARGESLWTRLLLIASFPHLGTRLDCWLLSITYLVTLTGHKISEVFFCCTCMSYQRRWEGSTGSVYSRNG